MPNPIAVPASYLHSSQRVQLLVVDIQERLIGAVRTSAGVLRQVERLIDAARLLEIPVHATEQYPKGLGRTLPSIAGRLPGEPVEKLRFSACVPEVRDRLEMTRAVVLVGIETHVCIAQTAAELVAAGFRVVLPRDAVSARHELDHETAIARMAAMGVTVTTSEALLFEWIESAGHPQFKAISRMVKEFEAGGEAGQRSAKDRES